MGAFDALDIAGSSLGMHQTWLDALANNIANVDTPHFRATTVDFESSLRDAVESGDAGRAGASLLATDTPVGPNGNNVDLRKEMLAATQTQFQYQLMTRAVSDQFTLLKISAGS